MLIKKIFLDFILRCSYVKVQKYKDLEARFEALHQLVWDEGGFKDSRGMLCDCGIKFRQGNDPIRLKHWNKYHKIIDMRKPYIK